MPYLYNNFLPEFQTKIETFFSTIKATFNFDLGPEFEVQICKMLRSFLPSKYGICRGFVVSKNGDKVGDDVIIFDQDKFPTLRLLPKDDFSLKEEIPIEAVYAYLEVKHNLTAESLSKAIQQVIAVKRLVSRREKVNLYQHDQYITSDLRPPILLHHLPTYRNPIFCAVIGRFSNSLDKSDEVNDFLLSQLNYWEKLSNYEFYPELIVGGANNIMCTSFEQESETKPTIFHLSEREKSGYQVLKKDGLAFAIFFTHLMAAIDFVRLGKMPW